jgi:hypothetical protein
MGHNLLALALLGGCGILIGVIFRWWGLLAPVGFACFLAYAWELDALGVTYAVIAGCLGSVAVVVGALARRALARRA